MLKPGIKSWFAFENGLPWVLLVLSVRIIIIAFFIQSSKTVCPERLVNGFILKQNDYKYFLAPVDQYFENGVFQVPDDPGRVFAGRMPGYSAPYFLSQSVFEKETALTILILLQVLLGAISVYLVAYMAWKILGSGKAFFIAIVLFGLNAPLVVFDVFTLAESFAISSVCFFMFFIYKYFSSRQRKYILLAGLFAGWSIFLRPFLGLLLLSFPLAILICERKKYSFRQIIWISFLFGLPFITFESLWIYRNYNMLGKFIPLETSLTESYGERGKYRTSAISIRKLIQSWGGETGEYYEGSEAHWFHEVPEAEARNYTFALYVFNSKFNYDSLLHLKRIFNASIDTSFTQHENDSLNMLASETALRYAEQYKQDNSLRFHLINPVKRAGRLVFSNATRLLPLPHFSNMNIAEKAIKLFSLFISYFIIVFGLVGLFFLVIKRIKSPLIFILSFVPLSLIFTLVFFSDIIEFRYFLASFPAFIIFTSHIVTSTLNHFSRIKVK